MTIRSVLALTDFSAQGEQALDRAALVAVEHGAELRIMYFVDVPNPNLRDPFERLAQRARQLARRHGISVEAVSRPSDTVDRVVEESACADLLVIDHRHHCILMRFWQGSTFDQLVRRCQCPVLVVTREPSRRYRRVLVAVDVSDESRELVRYACAFDVESELELFHSQSALHETMESRRHAEERLVRLSESLGPTRYRVRTSVGHGDPSRQTFVQQQETDADLVVVGKNRASALADFLFGGFAQRLLSWATSDVLVVPHDHRASSGAAAKLRIKAELGDGRGSFSVVQRKTL